MANFVTYQQEGKVAVITMDDGKANAAGFQMVDELNQALDRAEQDASGTLLLGRPGLLSGGFDLGVMRDGSADDKRRLSALGARLVMRLYGLPQPLVIGNTGHAVALGAFFLLCADRRVGIDGDFKIGLNETAIGMTLPTFAVVLCEARLDPRQVTNSAVLATLYSPAEAVDVGFLDVAVPADQHLETALAEATRLAELPTDALSLTKRKFRQAGIDRVLAELA